MRTELPGAERGEVREEVQRHMPGLKRLFPAHFHLDPKGVCKSRLMNSHMVPGRFFDRKMLKCRPAVFKSFLGPWTYTVQSSITTVSHWWVKSPRQVAGATMELNVLLSSLNCGWWPPYWIAQVIMLFF